MIISPDKSGNIDPIVYNIIQGVNSPIPIVPITRLNDFVFNDRLFELKEYVLVDFCEYGYDWDMKDTHLFGQNTYDFKQHFSTDEWQKFDNWVTENPPKLYFKRELLKKDVTENVIPIEYPCWYEIPPAQTEAEFNQRPIELFYFWGYSHESRRRIQGEIYTDAHKYGYMICDNIYYVEGFLKHESNPKKWVSCQIPHYYRIDISQILGINGMSKLSLSPPGAGRFCFRHAESPVNSVMVLFDDEMAWSYPWEHGVNCVKINEFNEVEEIANALRTDLYKVYLNGVEHIKNYQHSNYINNYLLKEINARVS